MYLISYMAEVECLSPAQVQSSLLPLVMQAGGNTSANVRKASIETVQNMCKVLSADIVLNQVVRSGTEAEDGSSNSDLSTVSFYQAPAFDTLTRDPCIIVRRAAAAVLVDVVKSIPADEEQADFAVTLAQLLYDDASDSIRQVLLENMGPLIYCFIGRVPEELLDIFTGVALFSDAQPTPLAHDDEQNAFDSSLSQATEANLWPKAGLSAASEPKLTWDPAQNDERAIITAYNLPGVLLSLGETGWPKLSFLHRQLATLSSSRARYLIASSIHDIANIIGPARTASDLLHLFQGLVKPDEEMDVALRAWERFANFVTHLPNDYLFAALQTWRTAWQDCERRNWRLRETLAEVLPILATKIDQVQDIRDPFLDMLDIILHDEIAAVRMWGVKAVRLGFMVERAPYAEVCSSPDTSNPASLARIVRHAALRQYADARARARRSPQDARALHHLPARVPQFRPARYRHALERAHVSGGG